MAKDQQIANAIPRPLLRAPNFKRDAPENVGSHPARNPTPRALQKTNFRRRGLLNQQISRRANPRNAQNRVGTPTTTNSGYTEQLRTRPTPMPSGTKDSPRDSLFRHHSLYSYTPDCEPIRLERAHTHPGTGERIPLEEKRRRPAFTGRARPPGSLHPR